MYARWPTAEKCAYGLPPLKHAQPVDLAIVRERCTTVGNTMRAVSVHCAAANARLLRRHRRGQVTSSTIRGSCEEAVPTTVHGEDIVGLGGPGL